MAALHGAAQRLQADVGRGAVTTVGQEYDVFLVDLALAVQSFVGRLDTAHHRRGVLERHMKPRHPPGGLWKRRGDDFHASGGTADDDVIAERLHDLPQSQYFAATLTSAVPR